MLNSLPMIIEKTLSVLLNTPIRHIRRIGATGGIYFGDDVLVTDIHGKTFVATKYSLHLQCAFRIINPDGVLLANLDMFEPNSQTKWTEDFDWNVLGTALYDERIEDFSKFLSGKTIVTAVKASIYGDLGIRLSSGHTIEVFNNLSAAEEIWRFFETGSNKPHFVVTGRGLEK